MLINIAQPSKIETKCIENDCQQQELIPECRQDIMYVTGHKVGYLRFAWSPTFIDTCSYIVTNLIFVHSY